MNDTTTLLEAICAELVDDGDTFTMDDGRVIRLKIEQEECDIFDLWEDCCYGKVEPVTLNRDYNYSERPRPAGFNGAARKLRVGRGHDGWWWQPPADVAQEHVESLRKLVTSIIEEGFWQVGVELLSGRDAYGQWIVQHAAWVGGIEPMSWDASAREHYAEFVHDQVRELLFEAGIAEEGAV